MKRTYALFALGSVLAGVEAKLLRWANNKRDADWRPAQATVAVNQLLHGMSPKPTIAPRAPDAAPEHSLVKRNSTDNTCAYISGITGMFLSSSKPASRPPTKLSQPRRCTATPTMLASTTPGFRPLDAARMCLWITLQARPALQLRAPCGRRATI